MNEEYLDILNPEKFQIDEREVLDLIIQIKEYSKEILFYNSKNKVDGTWHDLLKSDETFLIAEISKFNVLKYSSNRVNIIQRYDESPSLLNKRVIFTDFFNSTFSLFEQVNQWYFEAQKNNLSQNSSLIEIELEAAIQSKLIYLLKELKENHSDIKVSSLLDDHEAFNLSSFNSIWKIESELAEFPPKTNSIDENELNFAFKKTTLVFNSVYEIVYNLTLKSKNLFQKSLYENDNHKAHIGLLFSFIELLKYTKEDLNKLTKQHLDLYFKSILKLKPLEASPSKIYVTIGIDENIDALTLKENTLVKVGQYENGEDILFATDDEVDLNNISISNITTLFLSQNSIYDHDSRFNLISGLYSKTHADSVDEVDIFNQDKMFFSTLGEEQLFFNEEEMNMDKADIGFMLASPVFNLSKSDRTIEIDFKFNVDSINYLSDLILDLAKNKNSSEEAIFDEIFSNAFKVEFTAEEEWITLNSYKVISPEDWSTGVIKVSFKLDKTFPDIVPFDSDVHEASISSSSPIFRFTLNQDSFYNPYSFLNNMELNRIDINVKVKNLKKFNCYTNGEEVDLNADFDLFGAMPKIGSNLIIGSDELFNKKINKLSVNWDYANFSSLIKDFGSYYEDYALNITNESFKIKLSALSDFKYTNEANKQVFNLFEQTPEGELSVSKSINEIDVEALNIKPNYNLNFSDVEEYSNDLETGYLKIELTEPGIAFGFDVYDKVVNEMIQKSVAASPKKGESLVLKLPNEPFAPSISNLVLDYESKSTLIFKETSFQENDFDENNSFYITSPFGIEKTFSKEMVSKKTLVESFKYEGELIIGFDNYTTPSQLNLLFEILKSENQNYEFSRTIDWYYTSANGWKLFQKGDILNDQTMNLMKTGVLSLRMPADASESNNLFNQKKVFIKACSKSKSNQFSLIRSIRTNSISASEVLSEDPENTIGYIEPNSVEGLNEVVDGIINVDQYLGSFKGKSKESDIEFYLRSSELLRHKNRPVTSWDYEKFILSKFSWLSHVKCFPNIDNENRNNISILCIKKIQSIQNIDNIRLSSAEKEDIEEYLKSYVSPFTKIQIINPVFEDLWIKCKVSFKNIPNGKAIQKLQTDVFNFICSWIYDPKETNRIGIKIKKLDIVNFLKERPYVDFITGISIIHIKKLENGSQIAYDSAEKSKSNDYIESGSPWSLIIPKKNHKIEILDKNEFHLPEPIQYSELGIQESFLIMSDNDTANVPINPIDDKVNPLDSDDSKFTFTIKI